MFGHLTVSERHRLRSPWIAGSLAFHAALVTFIALTAVTHSYQGQGGAQEYTHLVFIAGLQPSRQPTGAIRDRPKTAGNPARPVATPVMKRLVHEVPPSSVPAMPQVISPVSPVSGMQVNSPIPGDGTEANIAGDMSDVYVSSGGMIAATLAPGTPLPIYPELVMREKPRAVVEVRYIIDTLGNVEDGSIQVISTPHPSFGDAVRTWLTRVARFTPAQLMDGRKVRQLAIQDITFVETSR